MNSLKSYLYILLLTLVYIFCATENANIDSWYYASCVKYGKELFNSHHLLYNLAGRCFFLGLKTIFPNTEAISALMLMNSLAAGASLLFLYHTLLLIRHNSRTSMVMTLLCGVSFGFMRFATDAETYILPLFFSLVATYFYCKSNPGNLFISGIAAALAILFHQLYLWWILSLLVFMFINRPIKLKNMLAFGIPLLWVLPVYYLVYLHSGEYIDFMRFLGGEYYKGNAGIEISMNSLVLSAINLFRSVFQIHGYMQFLWKDYTYLYLSGVLICISMLAYSLFSHKISCQKKEHSLPGFAASMFLCAMVLHILFAFVSSGNAEFMSMLPFLAVFFFHAVYQIEFSDKSLFLVGGIFIWNMIFGIIPNACMDMNQNKKQVELAITEPGAVFIWKDKNLVENIITYRKGFGHSVVFLNAEKTDTGLINKFLSKNINIYTETGNTGTRFSRRAMTVGNGWDKTLSQYRILKTDSFDNIYGKNYICRIQAMQ